MTLPKRNLDTMSEAIALSSPSGSMSNKSRQNAQKRLSVALFGEKGLPAPTCQQPSKVDRLLKQAKELRELAKRGMSPKKHIKHAEKLEAQAKEILCS